MRKLWTHLDFNFLFNKHLHLIILFLVSTALPVSAEWFKDYESAMEFIKKGQWDAAIPKLNSAISQKPDEGSNIKFYGMKFGDYFPHYYLGIAFYNTKDYAAAAKEFEESERFAAIRKKGILFESLTKLKTLSRAQLVVKSHPSRDSDLPTPAFTPPVTDPEVYSSVPTNQNTKDTSAKAIAEPPKANEENKTTESPRREEVKIQTDEKPVALPNIDLEMAKTLVRNGAQKYFEGDYDGAIGLLSTAIEFNSKDATSLFLLGCCYAAKYLLTGSENQEFLKNASLAFQKSKQINPNYRIKSNPYFSPAVLEIYTKAG